MSPSHAVVRIDHHRAQVLQFDTEPLQVIKVQSHTNDTQRGGDMSSELQFFGEVCDELAGIKKVVVTGTDAALSDFRRFVESSRAPLVSQIVGWEMIDRPNDGQSVAFARRYFTKRE